MNTTKHGQVLIEYIKKYKLKRIAEIGVYKGSTMRHILKTCRNIEEYWAVDPWKRFSIGHGKMHRFSQDIWDSMYKRVCLDMYYFKSLKVLRLSSKEAASLFPKSYFDLVFIDADHSYESVIQDINLWLPLTKKTRFLTGHDYVIPENKARHPGVAKAVNEIFGEENIIKEDAAVWIKQV